MKMLRAISSQMRTALRPPVFICSAVFTLFQVLWLISLLNSENGQAGAPLGAGVAYLLPYSMQSGLVFVSFLVLPTLPFSFSLVKDLDSHAALYWSVRSGAVPYTVSKAVAAAVCGGMVTGLGLLGWIVILRILTPWYVVSYTNDAYMLLFEQGKPLLGVLFYLLHYILTGALVAVCGMFVALLLDMRLAAFAGPWILHLFLSRLVSRLNLPIESVLFDSNWDLAIAVGGSAVKILLDKLLFVLIACALFTAVMIPLTKRRLSNG